MVQICFLNRHLHQDLLVYESTIKVCSNRLPEFRYVDFDLKLNFDMKISIYRSMSIWRVLFEVTFQYEAFDLNIHVDLKISTWSYIWFTDSCQFRFWFHFEVICRFEVSIPQVYVGIQYYKLLKTWRWWNLFILSILTYLDDLFNL